MRSGLLAALALAVIGHVAQAQTLAERPLPTGRDLTLTLPVAGNSAAELAQRMFTAADVPFGIEQAPPNPSEPSPRIDRPITDRMSFDGWTLRDALDKLVALDPRYVWHESNGRILFRTVALQHSAGLLQRRLPPLSLSHATAAAAIETLARLVAPSRAPGGIATLGMALTVGRHTQGRAAPPADLFTVSLREGPVLDTLNALGSAKGASWMITYDGPGAAADVASFSLITPAATTVAMSTAAMARIGGPRRLTIPVSSDLGFIVTIYALRTHLQTGFIQIPNLRPGEFTGHPPIDLTGLTPSEAFDRIVALDGRYEWTSDDGIYLVRPRRDVMPASPLDTPVDEFTVTATPVDAILDRIVSLLANGMRVGSSEGWSGRPAERAQQREGRQRPLSVVARRTTVRGVLNDLCKEEGTLMWNARFQDVSDERRMTIQLQSHAGWSVARTFTVRDGAAARDSRYGLY